MSGIWLVLLCASFSVPSLRFPLFSSKYLSMPSSSLKIRQCTRSFSLSPLLRQLASSMSSLSGWFPIPSHFLFPLFASHLSQGNTCQSRSSSTPRYSPSPTPPPPMGANWLVRHPTEFPDFLFPRFASHFSQANTYQWRNIQVTATQRYGLLFLPSPPPPTGTFVIPDS